MEYRRIIVKNFLFVVLVFFITAIITILIANIDIFVPSFSKLPKTVIYVIKAILFFFAIITVCYRGNNSTIIVISFILSIICIDMTVFWGGRDLIPLRFPYETFFSISGILIANLYKRKKRLFFFSMIVFIPVSFFSHYIIVPKIIRYMEKRNDSGILYKSPLSTGSFFSVDNSLVMLKDTLKGRCTIIEYYFVGCPPCEQKMKVLPQLYQDINSKELQIVLICAGEVTSFEKFKEHAFKNSALPFIFLYDGKGFKQNFMPGTNYPHEVIIDSIGKIYSSQIGFNNETKSLYLSENKETIKSILGD